MAASWDDEGVEGGGINGASLSNPWLLQTPRPGGSENSRDVSVSGARRMRATPPKPQAHKNDDEEDVRRGSTLGPSSASSIPSNPLYNGPPIAPSAGSVSNGSHHPQISSIGSSSSQGRVGHAEVTRPTLSRLTSSTQGSLSGLLYGLDRLAFKSGEPGAGSINNASTDSLLSTQDVSLNGARRSLEELRRLSITGLTPCSDSKKGKARLPSSTTPNSTWSFGEADLYSDPASMTRDSTSPVQGKEALLHQVEKGDTLVGIALLYGCTAQSIRTANKLWLNDPIQLRKTLYIPLESCTQPPSKEAEFIQRPGEDILHLYYRRTTSSAPPSTSTSKLAGNPSSRRTASAAMSDSSTTTHRSYHDSPFSSHRSSFSNGHESRPNTMPGVSYLSSTNSDYGNDDDLTPGPILTTNVLDHHQRCHSSPQNADTVTDHVSTPSHDPTSSSSSSVIKSKTIRIVRMPVHGSRSKAAGKSPLIAVDSLDEDTWTNKTSSPQSLVPPYSPPEGALLASSITTTLSSSLTPSASSERLNGLLEASTGDAKSRIRQRPRSPFDGDRLHTPGLPESTTPFPSSTTTMQSRNTDGSRRVGSAGDASSPTTNRLTLPPRTRKISKEAVPRPTKRSSSGAVASSSSSYLAAGSGFLSSLISSTTSTLSGVGRGRGDTGSNGSSSQGGGALSWFMPDEEEMQLARDYRKRTSGSYASAPNGITYNHQQQATRKTNYGPPQRQRSSDPTGRRSTSEPQDFLS